MKYLVTRSSFYGATDKSPIDGAVKENYLKRSVDNRFKTFEEHDKFASGATFLSIGQNHREEGGAIIRFFNEEGWFIEIENLKDFIGRVGDCVVSVVEVGEDDIIQIEIYDDYRE